MDRSWPWYTAVPTMHQAIVSAAAGEPPATVETSLRFIRSSSAPLLSAVRDRLERAFGVPVIEAYGMTEAGHQITSNPLPPGETKEGSVGAAAGPEVAVVDERGAFLPPDTHDNFFLAGGDSLSATRWPPEVSCSVLTPSRPDTPARYPPPRA